MHSVPASLRCKPFPKVCAAVSDVEGIFADRLLDRFKQR
jgi:hypothetical protein